MSVDTSLDPTVFSEEGQGAALDLHEGIASGRCSRWPKRLSLHSNFGEIVAGRCRSPNLCEYCARLSAIENAELLQLDSMQGVAPTSYLVLTQPSADRSPRAYYQSRNQLQRTLRQEIDGYEAAWLVEFTTGRAETSGGLRRPHFNALLKGVRTDAQTEIVRQVVEDVWCRRQEAAPSAQYVAPVQEIGGLTRYLALHFAKPSQAPPVGWRGHRFRATRGYLWRPTPEARKVARESLVNKRELWRSLETGASAAQAEEHVAWAAWVRSHTTWGIGHTPNYRRAVHA
jgi:hypothetical protein